MLNPYQVIQDNLNAYESERFYGKFQLDWEIINDLKFTYRIGLDSSVGYHETGTPNYSALYPNTPNYADHKPPSPRQNKRIPMGRMFGLRYIFGML